MRKWIVVLSVAATLWGGFFMPTMAADIEPSHTNGKAVEEANEATYHRLGMAALPDGRVLELTLAVNEDGAWLLIILHAPDGQRVAALPW